MTAATFRLPGPLGVMVAQVDQMSGGRIELGLGTGWYEAEHRAYGIPFPSVGERFSMLGEQLEILTGAWRTPVSNANNPARGRGIPLMRALSDRADIEISSGGTQVSLAWHAVTQL